MDGCVGDPLRKGIYGGYFACMHSVEVRANLQQSCLAFIALGYLKSWASNADLPPIDQHLPPFPDSRPIFKTPMLCKAKIPIQCSYMLTHRVVCS